MPSDHGEGGANDQPASASTASTPAGAGSCGPRASTAGGAWRGLRRPSSRTRARLRVRRRGRYRVLLGSTLRLASTGSTSATCAARRRACPGCPGPAHRGRRRLLDPAQHRREGGVSIQPAGRNFHPTEGVASAQLIACSDDRPPAPHRGLAAAVAARRGRVRRCGVDRPAATGTIRGKVEIPGHVVDAAPRAGSGQPRRGLDVPPPAAPRRRRVPRIRPQAAFEGGGPARATHEPGERDLRAARPGGAAGDHRGLSQRRQDLSQRVLASKPRRFDLGRYAKGQSKSGPVRRARGRPRCSATSTRT